MPKHHSILNYNRCGKLSTLTRNSASFNIYSIKIDNTSTTQSVIEDDNAPKQIVIDKTSNLGN